MLDLMTYDGIFASHLVSYVRSSQSTLMTPYVQNLFRSPTNLSTPIARPQYRRLSASHCLSAFYLGATIGICSLYQEITQRPLLILPFGSGSATVSPLP